jgi:hypothetical protein
MNKQSIGKGLKKELLKGYDIVRISRWAFQIFSNERSLDSATRDILEKLFSMEDDPQFELSQEELTQLADKLIEEGEREDLEKPDPEIKETAVSIGDNWLMCPVCQEAWEDFLKYRMVRCPKCNTKLNNPKLKNRI